jgi:branched-chain amino acid aminotransferase
MQTFRLNPRETDDEIKAILNRLVALTGLQSSYVAVDCLRGRPPVGVPYHPAYARNYISAFALPWISIVTPEMMQRGAHLIVGETLRIPASSVDPRAKNFHWGDLTRGQFEAFDRCADFAILLDEDGNVTEGAGFNIFIVRDGAVLTPDFGMLEGITRRSVFELCGELGIPAEARKIAVDEMRDADEIFMATTAGGIMPASRIDGRIMGNDRPGPVSMRLHDAFWARRAEGWHATPVDYSAAANLADAPL